MIKGMKWLPGIVRGLERSMDERGYPDVAAMRGIATEGSVQDYAGQFAQPRIQAVVDWETCRNPTCNICARMCFYEALPQNSEFRLVLMR